MGKKSIDQPGDKDLFRAVLDGVVPLRTAPLTDSRATPTPVPEHTQKQVDTAGYQVPGSSSGMAHSGAVNDGTSHRKDGTQKKLVQKLKRGHFPVRDQLDLHHMSGVQGRQALLAFIRYAQTRDLQCVRIVHGKGLHSKQGPILKTMTRQILQQHPQVLAYCICKPAHGGDGATNVLLKR